MPGFRPLLAGTAVLLVGVVGAPGALAAEEVEIGTAAEAWYSSSPLRAEDPVCAPTEGCPARPHAGVHPYPPDTLHVGALSGREDARTYVRFDRAALPDRARLTGGTATLPVADERSGTMDPDSAAIVACLVTEQFEEAEGGEPDDAAPVDCSTSAPAAFDPEERSFTLDLNAFVTRWSAGTPDHGIALLADPADERAATWHVAFSARDRQEQGAASPITAMARLGEQDEERPATGAVGPGFSPGASSSGASGSAAPSVSFASAPATGGAGPSVADPGPQVAPPQAAPSQPETPAPPPVAAATRGGDRYEAIWFLPLLLLALAAGLARSVLADVRVLPPDALPSLPFRLWEAFFPPDRPEDRR